MHDSVVLDLHPDEIVELVPKIKYIMENLPIPFLKFDWKGQKNIQFPIAAEVEIGSTYHDVHEYEEEEYSTFNSVEGFTKYNNKIKFIEDSLESKYIGEEEAEQVTKIIESKKPDYQLM